jgi:hypothetical protein
VFRRPTRREFLRNSVAVVSSAGMLGRAGFPLEPCIAAEASERVRLKSWELVELPTLTTRPGKDGRKMALRITAQNGAVGVMPARFCRRFSDATVEILKANNLLAHG